jgi:hypothetical protein
MGWAGYVASMGNMRGAYSVFVGRPERKRQLKRRSCGCENNINIDLQDLGCGAWDRLIWLRIWTGGVLL